MIELVNFLSISYELQLQTRNWRNQKNVSDFFKIKFIDEETHTKWLHKLTEKKPTTIAFLIKYDNNFVGVTYFHSISYERNLGEWGIYISNENIRGLGIGTMALSECINFAKNNLKLKKIYLYVLNTNNKAISLYEKIGFRLIENKSKFLRYEKEL